METIVDTDAGKVVGREKRGVLLFAGLPYAAPPVGERRFRPPQPVEPWEGTREATRFSPWAPQSARGLGAVLAGAPVDWDEDCLYLNVQTPALDDARRPVMVWIHGGAFVSGSGAVPWYDGAKLATRGDVVIVSINYRLGALGWLHLGHLDESYAGSGNNGLLDQIAALQWVQRNIAAFGGNPEDVTIFGESAGGMSVGTLLGTPEARGLFHRAIAQSGASQNVASTEIATDVTEHLLETAGVSTVAELVALDVEALLAAQDAVSATGLRGRGVGAGLPFGPVVDGTVLRRPPMDEVRDGLSAHVPLLIGTNRDEWTLFAMADKPDLDEETVLRRLSSITGDPHLVLEAYTDGSTIKQGWIDLMTDLVFRIPAIRLAEAQRAHQPSTFMYFFEWPTPVFGGAMGATHALEIPFVFDNLDRGGVQGFLGDDPPAALATEMQRAWLAFVHHDDPTHDGLPAPWPAFDEVDRATMHFGVPSHLEHDPAPRRREVWSGIR